MGTSNRITETNEAPQRVTEIPDITQAYFDPQSEAELPVNQGPHKAVSLTERQVRAEEWLDQVLPPSGPKAELGAQELQERRIMAGRFFPGSEDLALEARADLTPAERNLADQVERAQAPKRKRAAVA